MCFKCVETIIFYLSRLYVKFFFSDRSVPIYGTDRFYCLDREWAQTVNANAQIGSKNEFLPKRRQNVVDRVACRRLSFRGSGRNFSPSVLYCFRLKQFNECYFRSNNLIMRELRFERIYINTNYQANFGKLIIRNCLNRLFSFIKKVLQKNGKKNKVELKRIAVWLWMENHRHEPSVSHFDNIDSLDRKQSLPKKRSLVRGSLPILQKTRLLIHLWAIFFLCALKFKRKEKEIIRSFEIITISNVIRTKLKFKFYSNLSKGKKRGKFLEFSFSLLIY